MNSQDASERIKSRTLKKGSTLLDALKLMDHTKSKLLLVFHDEHFIGLLSIGDIQRAIIHNLSLETPVETVLRDDIVYCTVDDDAEAVKGKLIQYRTECMPILDHNKNLVTAVFWEDLFPGHQKMDDRKVNLPVVIMAGGRGERLKPITNIIPKPLIPLGDKSMIEIIMDNFIEVGSTSFFMMVNYKADVIKYYLGSLGPDKYYVEYCLEDFPMGTIGSISLLKGRIHSTFFVSNCDILIEDDYRKIYDFHVSNHNELTLVAALKNYRIPYGVVQKNDEGLLSDINEKPEYSYFINTGVYILEPHLLNEIPENAPYQITELIEKVNRRGGRVGVFPVSEGSWIDIGEWKMYNSTMKKLGLASLNE
jgi:dTDP-glucose pyrophosphorylase